jgi:hypothetical protein
MLNPLTLVPVSRQSRRETRDLLVKHHLNSWLTNWNAGAIGSLLASQPTT